MKDLFYVLAILGFGFSLFTIGSRWGAFGYGFEYYLVYHVAGGIAFMIGWLVLAFREKTKRSRVLSIASLFSFILSTGVIIYAMAIFL